MITETTPPRPVRTFTLEVDEDQLVLILLWVSSISTRAAEKLLDAKIDRDNDPILRLYHIRESMITDEDPITDRVDYAYDVLMRAGDVNMMILAID